MIIVLGYNPSMRKSHKERLTVTVDPAFVRVGNEAVASGRATSLSAWVNGALAERVKEERRLAAMDEAIAAYEARRGKITDEEVVAQWRADRRNAIKIVARAKSRKPRRAA